MQQTMRKTNDNANDDDKNKCDKGPWCVVPHKMALKPTSQHAHTKSSIHSSLHQVRAPCVDIQLMTHKMARETTRKIVVPKTLP